MIFTMSPARQWIMLMIIYMAKSLIGKIEEAARLDHKKPPI